MWQIDSGNMSKVDLNVILGVIKEHVLINCPHWLLCFMGSRHKISNFSSLRYALQEDKFYYGDVLKQTDVKIKSLLTPDCGASVLEEKVFKHSTIIYLAWVKLSDYYSLNDKIKCIAL